MSPQARARVTGVVYLLFFVTAVAGAAFMPVAGGPIRVAGDAASIADRITSHQATYELGIGLGLISTALYVLLTGLFYALFRPVSRTLSVLAAFSSLVGCAVGAVGSLTLLEPLEILTGSYSRAFGPEQLQALALLFLNLNAQANHVALTFFGVFQLLLGYLIYRSGFLPPILGVLIAVAGVGWLLFLIPPLVSALVVYLEVLGFVAEALLMVWLLVRGVNAARWAQLASRP